MSSLASGDSSVSIDEAANRQHRTSESTLVGVEPSTKKASKFRPLKPADIADPQSGLRTRGRLGSLIKDRPKLKQRKSVSTVACLAELVDVRRNFILRLAKALIMFGAPTHRIESQLEWASTVLDAHADFVHIPNIIIVTFGDGETEKTHTHFVRASGRVALTNLHMVHEVSRAVLHDTMTAAEGIDNLKRIMRSRPIYPLWLRCVMSFICASIMCGIAFGGSVVDVGVAGACAGFLQYLGLNACAKSAMYANVYEISVTIIVSFLARGLSTIRGNVFCYNAISSAGVIMILPGFTILISALELMSRNILCGSVRIVYSIIYTLFLGFGLTIGSDFYYVIDRHARALDLDAGDTVVVYEHGIFAPANTSMPVFTGTFAFPDTSSLAEHIVHGCYRGVSWPWWKQPFPWWTLFFLVPIYSICSSIANLQTYRSWQLPVMVAFSSIAYAANHTSSIYLPGRSDIVSACGAFVIGALGNLYSRLAKGTAFTAMVTGVLFLVPSSLAHGGGLSATYTSSTAQYSSGFTLALRMIQVSIGITIGLFLSQILVYAVGTKKKGAHFAF